MTREAWERAARDVWEFAYARDPVHTMEATIAITGAEVFVWTNLTTGQIRAFHRTLFSTARLA